jgi:hypothetical protein
MQKDKYITIIIEGYPFLIDIHNKYFQTFFYSYLHFSSEKKKYVITISDEKFIDKESFSLFLLLLNSENPSKIIQKINYPIIFNILHIIDYFQIDYPKLTILLYKSIKKLLQKPSQSLQKYDFRLTKQFENRIHKIMDQRQKPIVQLTIRQKLIQDYEIYRQNLNNPLFMFPMMREPNFHQIRLRHHDVEYLILHPYSKRIVSIQLYNELFIFFNFGTNVICNRYDTQNLNQILNTHFRKSYVLFDFANPQG